jgi:DNA (cytosine-5)-methyltransferase 1
MNSLESTESKEIKKYCGGCLGTYPLDKHDFVNCRSIDLDWDLLQMKQIIRYIDLFAGTGGFSEAIKSFGNFRGVYANDMIKSSKTIYELNHTKNIFDLQDLTTVSLDNIPSHDMICGGFPCQPFSIAGKRLGFEDSRSNVFWKILEIVKKYKPYILIFENVKNLTTHDDGKTFDIIIKSLKENGYHIKYKVLDTCKITKIPHHRERIYIVCFKNKEICDRFNFEFPINNGVKNISELLETNVGEKYYYSDRFKDYEKIRQGVVKNISTNTVYQYRRHYVRENKNGVCPTLTANMGGGGHNVPLIRDNIGIRKFTPRECFNLQGFPSSYKLPNMSDSDLYKLAGNAITVEVVSLIVSNIFELL